MKEVCCFHAAEVKFPCSNITKLYNQIVNHVADMRVENGSTATHSDVDRLNFVTS